jgi:hypothetical protein
MASGAHSAVRQSAPQQNGMLGLDSGGFKAIMTLKEPGDAAANQQPPHHRLRKFGRWFLCALSATAIVALALGIALRPDGPRSIPPNLIQQESGNAYMVKLDRLYKFAYEIDPYRQRRPSPLQLTENGLPLGPSHTTHDAIRGSGGGAYSHWGNRLWMSTSDNSDPRFNQRRYQVTAPVRLKPSWLWSLLFIAAGSALVALLTDPALVSSGYHGRVRRLLNSLAAVLTVLATLALGSNIGIFTSSWQLPADQLVHSRGDVYYQPLPAIISPFLVLDKDTLRVEANNVAHNCVLGEGYALSDASRCAYDGVKLFIVMPKLDAGAEPNGLLRVSHGVEVHPYVVGALWLLAALLHIVARQASLARMVFVGSSAITAVGAALLAVNVYGLSQPLRHPLLSATRGAFYPVDLTLSAREAFAQLRRQPQDSDESYAVRATMAVANAVLHRWQSAEFVEYRVRIPVWENWVLHLLGLIDPKLHAYIFWDHRRGLLRGIGECGHVASILVGYLREHGVDARMVSLNGHVVVTANVGEGRWHILDPDSGVIIRNSLEGALSDPSVLTSAYSERLSQVDMTAERHASLVDEIVGFYIDSEGDQVDPMGRLAYYSGMASSPEWYGQRESLSYGLKWFVPAGLVMLGLLGLYLRRVQWSRD